MRKKVRNRQTLVLWMVAMGQVFAIWQPTANAEFVLQGLPAFGLDAYTGTQAGYGILLFSKSQYYFGDSFSRFRWGPMVELDFKMIIPDVIAGAGFRFGNSFFFSLDGGAFWSLLWGTGLGVAPGLGYQLTPGLFIIFPFTTKYTFSGVLIFEYLPQIGYRF